MYSNGLIWVQRTDIQAPIHDTAFTYGRTISTTTDENNGESTIPEDNDEQHYYYGYNISRQLIYLELRIFIPGLGRFFNRLGYGSASSLGDG